MPGLADYLAQAQINHASGAIPLTTNYSRFVALFTALPTADAGTGGTEVSGGSYARVQVAGRLQAASSGGPWAGTSVTLSGAAPAWLTALGTNGSGCNVFDATSGLQVGTVSSVSGSTITLSATATNSVANNDFLYISAFPQASASTGTEPAITPASVANAAQINFATSSAAWGTILGWGLYDASSSGNLYYFDYLGSGKWSPFTCTPASPGVLTVTDQTFTNGASVAVSSKAAGALPSLSSGSWAGLQTVAGVSGNTFNVGLNTTSIGDGLVRPVTTAAPGTPVTTYFPAASFTLVAA
ncbi:MAG: hypothetical protein WAN43_16045 [Rhodomicrobium sp.]